VAVKIAARQAEIDAIAAEMFPATERRSSSDRLPVRSMEDEDVLARARAAANSMKFEHLWRGDDSGYDSASEADLALCSILAFWTQDVDQIDRLFRQSGLMRDKWDRVDYRDATIAKALSVDAADASRADAVEGSTGRRLRFRPLAEIFADIPEEPEWVVPGFVAPQTETLLYGPPKVGKSTLLFRLLAALETGGTVFGLDVRKVSYALLSEENAWTLQEKAFDFGLRGRGGEASLYQEARGLTWVEVIQETVARCTDKGHELLIVDTFSRWAGLGGESENHAGSIEEAWRPLAAAKDAGLATVVLHHTRKSGGKHGEGIRGSNAIAALPDILLELARTGGEDATARVLNADSRYRSTPDVLGLTYTGSDYEVTTDMSALRGGTAAKVLELLAAGPMTKAELAEAIGITVNALDVHLKRHIEADRVFHTGAGNRQEPYRYHLR
jgi:hypothetical protein